MKAIAYQKYGSPDVLELAEVEKQEPKADEVLVKVHAVSINDWDWGLLHGEPFVNRLISGIRKPKYTILGSDIAGVVEQVGENVQQFLVGDEVYGDLSGRWGGFAEYVCAKEDMLVLKPTSMSFEQAAAIPQAALLALQGLRKAGEIRSGQKVLVNGAGGGVGTFVIQIAKVHDIEITGVDSADKLDMLLSLGYDHVIDYKNEDFTKSGKRYDLILDVKTDRSISDYLRVLNPHGTYVTVGGSMSRLFQIFLLGPWVSIFKKKTVRMVGLAPNKGLADMNELFEAGKLVSVSDTPYALEQVPQAMRYFGEGKHKGKVIIVLGDKYT